LGVLTDSPVSISRHDVKGGRPNHSLYCGCDDLCAKLVTDTDEKRQIPSYVWDWSRDEQLAFIVGLMDSEGFVAANSNRTNRRFYMGFKSTDVWVREFVRLLEVNGIRTGKVSAEAPRKPGYRVPIRFHIKMQSWVDSGAKFNIARKQSRVDGWASSGAYENRLVNPRRLTPETNTQGTP